MSSCGLLTPAKLFRRPLDIDPFSRQCARDRLDAATRLVIWIAIILTVAYQNPSIGLAAIVALIALSVGFCMNDGSRDPAEEDFVHEKVTINAQPTAPASPMMPPSYSRPGDSTWAHSRFIRRRESPQRFTQKYTADRPHIYASARWNGSSQ